MGYIREPKNVDFVIAPSVLTVETKKAISQAITQYKQTGKAPISVAFMTQGSFKGTNHRLQAEESKQIGHPIKRLRYNSKFPVK
jgi:hypothetical protein